MTAAIYNEINPAGFDLQVAEIQSWLGKLSFIEAIFGVAKEQYELRRDNTTNDTFLNEDFLGRKKWERYYPQGRKLGGDVDLSPDDTYTSRIFFLVKDNIKTNTNKDDWDWTEANIELCQPFSIIVQCNIDKVKIVEPTVDSSEKVKLGILYALNNCSFLKVISMSENLENVWKEFTLVPEINGFTRYPNYMLRLECEAWYYAFNNNGSTLGYDPSGTFDENKNITPNSNTGYPNVN